MGPLHMIGLVFVVSDLSTPVQGAVIIFHIFTSYSPLIKRANSSANSRANSELYFETLSVLCKLLFRIHNTQCHYTTKINNTSDKQRNAILKCNIRNELYVS